MNVQCCSGAIRCDRFPFGIVGLVRCGPFRSVPIRSSLFIGKKERSTELSFLLVDGSSRNRTDVCRQTFIHAQSRSCVTRCLEESSVSISPASKNRKKRKKNDGSCTRDAHDKRDRRITTITTFFRFPFIFGLGELFLISDVRSPFASTRIGKQNVVGAARPLFLPFPRSCNEGEEGRGWAKER